MGDKYTDNIDVIFIYPPLSVKERYGGRITGDIGGYVPPLGILSLAAYLRVHGYNVAVIDSLINCWDVEQTASVVIERSPKIVGFSAITPIYHRAVNCANIIKKKSPNQLIVLGGHHASVMCEDIIKKDRCFDIVAFGEGELTMLELIECYRSKDFNCFEFIKDYDTLRKIKGIAFRQKDGIIINDKRELIQDVDELPLPARDLVPIEKYIPLPNQYKLLPSVHMVVIRGCPYKCAFCSNNSVFGRKIRARSPEKVIYEIKCLKEKYDVKEISFWDDMMTSNKRWLVELCDLMIQNELGITWTCYSRVDTVTKELLLKMKKAGCWNIFFGFESGVQDLLENINKGITLEQIQNASRWCKEVGIEIRASFMLALPGETPELAQKTIDFAKKLNPEYAQFCITTPYPGTKLYDEAEKWGRLSLDYSKFNIWEPVFIPYGYKDKDQINKLEKKATFEFYFRPIIVINLLKKLKSWEDIKRYYKGFKMALGFARSVSERKLDDPKKESSLVD